MARGANRWLAPAGICILVSLTCLAFLFSSAKPGGRLLGPRRQSLADTYASFAVPEHPCTGKNGGLVDFMAKAVRSGSHDPLLPESTDYNGFIEELKVSLEKHHLPMRAIDYLFDTYPLPEGAHPLAHGEVAVHPSCAGDYMEFGVFTAESTNKTAKWRKHNCHHSCPPIYGFDTFTGLPEQWSQEGGGGGFENGAFSLQGQFPRVEENIHLIKGLFSDSIPPFLQLQKEMTGKDPRESLPLSYLHIDCDLYAGSRDALTLLSHKIVPGTVLLFDELVNYNTYREHEIKALFEWLLVSGAKIATIGMKGPLAGESFAFDKDIAVKEHHQHSQSAAFVVVHKPGASTRIAW